MQTKTTEISTLMNTDVEDKGGKIIHCIGLLVYTAA